MTAQPATAENEKRLAIHEVFIAKLKQRDPQFFVKDSNYELTFMLFFEGKIAPQHLPWMISELQAIANSADRVLPESNLLIRLIADLKARQQPA